jgi:hypothetical protein
LLWEVPMASSAIAGVAMAGGFGLFPQLVSLKM